jgi:hypothetical protein
MGRGVADVGAGPSLEEHAAGAGGFFLGEAALLLGITAPASDGRAARRAAPVLRADDRAAEIAGQRRAEDRAGIVARQAGETIGVAAVVGRIEFLAALAASRVWSA